MGHTYWKTVLYENLPNEQLLFVNCFPILAHS
jgi:hypothetical protein